MRLHPLFQGGGANTTGFLGHFPLLGVGLQELGFCYPPSLERPFRNALEVTCSYFILFQH